ncbi:putative mitochondrial F1F0-ATP synthase, subunit f, partial [Trypoxylus dichotomus]
NVDTKNY